jgi:hypothetical protein
VLLGHVLFDSHSSILSDHNALNSDPEFLLQTTKNRLSDLSETSTLEFIERGRVTFRGNSAVSFGDDNLQWLRIQAQRSFQGSSQTNIGLTGLPDIGLGRC